MKIKQLGRVFKKESSGMRKRLKYGNLSKQDSTSDHDAHIEGVIGAKDASCFLFHALGKILHFKSMYLLKVKLKEKMNSFLLVNYES